MITITRSWERRPSPSSQADYSQESFAAVAGIHRTHLGLAERERVSATSVIIQKLADALGMTASELLTESEHER